MARASYTLRYRSEKCTTRFAVFVLDTCHTWKFRNIFFTVCGIEFCWARLSPQTCVLRRSDTLGGRHCDPTHQAWRAAIMWCREAAVGQRKRATSAGVASKREESREGKCKDECHIVCGIVCFLVWLRCCKKHCSLLQNIYLRCCLFCSLTPKGRDSMPLVPVTGAGTSSLSSVSMEGPFVPWWYRR